MAKNSDKLGISTQYEGPVVLLKKWVDFHYEDEDETYNYSVQGGSVILFADLSAALNIGIDPAEVADVAFSDESLMKPVHVEEDTTVRALIEALGLDIEYTADLTKEAISAMNARFVRAGDWVLISLHPFDTEEMLTLTTSDGKRYEIAVTDARIQKDFLTAGGETFTITITYGDDAHIPDDSDLNVTEILQGTEEFEKYLNQSAEKLGVESSEVSFARFFDAEITKDGVKVEPDAPVQVEIAYKEAIEIGTGETLSVVHFGENTEVINDLTLSDGDTCITYAQDSFSVTGTIISGTPENGEKQYMVITKIDNRYYIVNNNGTLTEVGYDESSGTVVVTNPMLWTFDNSNNGNRHIYFNSQATGFGDNQVASDFFRRYLVPNETTGACLEETRDDPADAGYLTVTVAKDGEWINREDHNKVVETNHVSNRNNALNATALNIATNGATSTISHNGQYLTVVRDGAGNPVSLGTGTSGEAAQFMFATASKVPSGLHLDNAVNHIDISINGTASVKVPLAYGTYRIGSANGDEWVVEDNVYLELNEDDIPDSVVIDGVTMSREDQLKITAEDMKRATIAAFDKNGEELNDAFYITGYSQNATPLPVRSRFELKAGSWRLIYGGPSMSTSTAPGMTATGGHGRRRTTTT